MQMPLVHQSSRPEADGVARTMRASPLRPEPRTSQVPKLVCKSWSEAPRLQATACLGDLLFLEE